MAGGLKLFPMEAFGIEIKYRFSVKKLSINHINKKVVKFINPHVAKKMLMISFIKTRKS